MSKLFKIRLIVTVLIIAILASVISVAIVIENKSNVIVIGDNVVLDDKTHELPKNLVFAVSNTVSNSEPFTEKSVKLTATVKPDHATNKALNWSVDWVDSQSKWASGKNISDYLTLSSDGVTATLTCKAPFGEKANIVAQSVDNANAKATCVIDFLSDFNLKYEFFVESNGLHGKFAETIIDKILQPDINKTGDIIAHDPDVKLVNFDFDEETITSVNEGTIYNIKISPEYTTGTVYPTVKIPLILKLSSLSVSFKKIALDKYNANITPIEPTINIARDNDGYYRISNYTLMVYIAASVISFDINNNLDIDAFFLESFKNCSMQITSTEFGSYEYNGKTLGNFLPNICFGIHEKTCKYFNVKTVSFDKVNDYLTF